MKKTKAKQYKSKWRLVGLNTKELKKLYSKNRSKADTILKRNHKKEYALILNNLMNEDYKKLLKTEMKGGLKEDEKRRTKQR